MRNKEKEKRSPKDTEKTGANDSGAGQKGAVTMNVLNLTKAAKGILMTAAAALTMAGCGEGAYALSEAAPRIEQTKFSDSSGEYDALVCGGREYVFYGVAQDGLSDDDIGSCAGYIDEDKKERVFTLYGTNDYIMQAFVGGFVDQPVFYRAKDTLGERISTPGYIACRESILWATDQGA